MTFVNSTHLLTMVVALFFVAFLQISSASTRPQIANANAELQEVLGEIVNSFCETEEIADSLEWFSDNCPELKQASLWQFKANEILKMRNTPRRTKYSDPQENEIEENRMKTIKKRLLWLKPPKDVSMKLMCMNVRIIIFIKTIQYYNIYIYIYTFSLERCERLPKKVSFRC